MQKTFISHLLNLSFEAPYSLNLVSTRNFSKATDFSSPLALQFNNLGNM